MRRWIFIAALSTGLLAVPLWAQRGGMGMGGHGGMAMGGGHSYAGTSRGVYGGGSFHGGYVHGAYGYHGHYPYHPGHYPYYFRRYPYYRWGYPWGYGSWYGYPWLSVGWYGGYGWDGGDYSYPAQSYPSYVNANLDDGNDSGAYNQQQAQIDQLNNEVDRLRAEADTVRSYAPQPPSKPEIRAETVLVFRDRHSEEIQNYAIVGKTLWVFTEQRARKIPIAELDVPATTKANEARDVDFRLPTP
jgi:hypothetical protein